jgi:DHA3 family macrolide efflux protein-like MFS transporter
VLAADSTAGVTDAAAITAAGSDVATAPATATAAVIAADSTDSTEGVTAAQSERAGLLHEFKLGMRYIRRHPFVLAFVIIGVIFSVFATPASLLTPLQVTREFGADPWRLGAIEVAFAVGMMAGGVVIGIWGGFKNRSTTMAFATLGFGLCTIGLGLLNNFWLYLSCMALAGVILPMFNAPSMAVLQARVDPDFLGRVFSVLMMTGSLAMPFGMLVFGPIADVVPIDWLLIGTGIAIIPLALAFIMSRTVHEAGLLPEPPAVADAAAPAETAEPVASAGKPMGDS